VKPFALVRPATLEEALAQLPAEAAQGGVERVKLLAGGQDLLTELKEHLAGPELVVDLAEVPGLDRIEPAPGGGLAIGALVTLAELEHGPAVRERFAVLAEAAASVASPQIRSQGTVGGNLCQRPRCWYYRNEDAVCLKKGGTECFSYGGLSKYNAILGGGPSYIVHPSDLAPALVALDAEVTLASLRGERSMPLERFFTLPSEGDVRRENVLLPDELVLRVAVPAPDGPVKSTYLKLRERGSYDFALASAALALRLENGVIRDARIVLGGVAPVPWRSQEAEDAVRGKPMRLDTWEAAAEAALADAEPLEDNAYKVPLAKGAIVRAFERLAGA
jgi:xanthine dehydrogenase YagS FAD-binding subunit